MVHYLKTVSCVILFILTISCSNIPYSYNDIKGKTALKTYSTELKYVDPVKSYYVYEAAIIDQIYEYLFQYHYLKRPYELIPCLARFVPKPVLKVVTVKEPYTPRRFQGNKESFKVKKIKVISYTIKIKEGVFYSPSPCFPLNKKLGARSREVTAHDFLYAFKRIADPRLACPIFPVLVPKIVGMDLFYQYNQDTMVKIQKGDTLESIALKYYGDKKFANLISRINNNIKNQTLQPEKTVLKIIKETDYSFPITGIIVHDKYTFEVLLKEPYPQILYWMAMHFTSPMPEEAIHYYKKEYYSSLPEDIRLKSPFYLPWPVGTGPFVMKKWKSRQEIVLLRNPLFREETYPDTGMPSDEQDGLLTDRGKKMPFLDKIIYKYDPEYISVWNKFNQGYIDASGIGKEHFNKIIDQNKRLSKQMRDKGIRLKTDVASDIFYYGFNMYDPVVGGYSEKKKYLRKAIAKALDVIQYKRIFRNNRGIIPLSPVPPGIYGYQEKVDSYNRYDLKEARILLEKAGYKGGIDPRTGRPLEITYDNASTSSAARPHLLFFKEQIERLGIKIKLATTDLNRYRQKIFDGNYQIFDSGWLLDYPDPENFLFLLYGPNGVVKYHGDNRANYNNPEFNLLFEKMATMENNQKRLMIIKKMIDIVNDDCPWIYLFHSEDYYLFHSWYQNVKVTDLINNVMKYIHIIPELRMKYIKKYNRPIYWPLILMIVILIATFIPAVRMIRRKYR